MYACSISERGPRIHTRKQASSTRNIHTSYPSSATLVPLGAVVNNFSPAPWEAGADWAAAQARHNITDANARSAHKGAILRRERERGRRSTIDDRDRLPALRVIKGRKKREKIGVWGQRRGVDLAGGGAEVVGFSGTDDLRDAGWLAPS